MGSGVAIRDQSNSLIPYSGLGDGGKLFVAQMRRALTSSLLWGAGEITPPPDLQDTSCSPEAICKHQTQFVKCWCMGALVEPQIPV